MRIGIIGTGGMGKTHALSWRQTPVTLAGFVSRSGRSDLANEFGGRVFNTLEEMLPYVDVVDICTPTFLHHAQCIAAAKAGKHVVCEKPLASSVAEAEEMIQVCAAQGVQLLVAHVLRYFPDYANAHAVVARGEIGAVRRLDLRRASLIPFGAQNSWFTDPTISGGVLLDLIIHDFDFARWLAGDVTEASLESVAPDISEAVVLLKHAGGAISRIEGVWNRPGNRFETSVRIEGDVAGAANVIAFDNTSPKADDSNLPYMLQAQDFYAALTEGRTPRVSAQDALAALKISLVLLAQRT